MIGFRRLATLALCAALVMAPLNAMAQEIPAKTDAQPSLEIQLAQANPFPQPLGKPPAQPKQGSQKQASGGNPAATPSSSAIGNVATVT